MTKELSTLLSQVHYFFICHLSFFLDMEATGGFEPPHKGFADLSLSHLGTSPKIKKSERRDLNPRQSRWQRDALPAELLSLN